MALHYVTYTNRPEEEKKLKILKAPEFSRPEPSSAWRELLIWFNRRLNDILVNMSISSDGLEEIRLRVNKPLALRLKNQEVFLGPDGRVASPSQAYCTTREDLDEILERITQSSFYAAEEEIRQGFITLPGGHRVGITGEAVLKQGQIQTLKHLTGLNFRIAHEISGLGAGILPFLIAEDGRFCHSLILSRPMAGKTTLLRALIRLLSSGEPGIGLAGQTVGVVDERGELAGMWRGIPAYDLGYRTDVLDGCPKALGMGMLIRAMAPQIIAVDEIGRQEDVEAISEAMRSGVSILSTAHAGSLAEARERPSLNSLLGKSLFERVVILSRRLGPGTVESIVEPRTGRELWVKNRSSIKNCPNL